MRADVLAQHAGAPAGAARVDADDFPLVVDLGDLNLVGGDQAAAHEVDQVTREQVLGEQEFARATLETTQVHALALKGHAALAQPADLSNRHEEVATLDADDRAHDRGVELSPRRATRSWTRPIRPPSESKIGRCRNVERWRISVM